jgi:hypothetical protein
MNAPKARSDRSSFFIGISDASMRPFIRDSLGPDCTVGVCPDMFPTVLPEEGFRNLMHCFWHPRVLDDLEHETLAGQVLTLRTKI